MHLTLPGRHLWMPRCAPICQTPLTAPWVQISLQVSATRVLQHEQLARRFFPISLPQKPKVRKAGTHPADAQSARRRHDDGTSAPHGQDGAPHHRARRSEHRKQPAQKYTSVSAGACYHTALPSAWPRHRHKLDQVWQGENAKSSNDPTYLLPFPFLRNLITQGTTQSTSGAAHYQRASRTKKCKHSAGYCDAFSGPTCSQQPGATPAWPLSRGSGAASRKASECAPAPAPAAGRPPPRRWTPLQWSTARGPATWRALMAAPHLESWPPPLALQHRIAAVRRTIQSIMLRGRCDCLQAGIVLR